MWLWPVPRSRPGSLSQVEAKLSQRCSGNPSPWTFQDSSRFSCTNWKPKYSSGRWWDPPLSTQSHFWVKPQEFLSQSVGHFYDPIGFLDIFTGWQRLPIKFRRAPETVNISAAGCWVSAEFLSSTNCTNCESSSKTAWSENITIEHRNTKVLW